ncbi:NADPH-dependent 2,4-dienoyl-CoA reductase/sulfur reductase-like enzyme [Hydrogenivirga caldilitoris]|uniref:NADPH-dependent 2,4-dienoyl-CoA reductase/sulfur reductase-like enzyme n=1 Tax=Hydrogenivirga caldilitoris TaxID=246264 RepID=A0A497XWL1_9AQUI|nr:FAD/NAD(P)-binding oxidoreductase [Hydrogenivirga caldilitoris]RLJ71153.1 NADPH-dependent 2,4-dienoyl-CoA reductase/sulfur reductase-like enzyme [Hydrogenivirga caldilitoris]
MQKKSSGVSRRGFITGSAIALAMTGVPTVVAKSKTSLLSEPRGKRVVVVGGGYGGVTAAKYIKKENPEAEVVLIEKNQLFVSCPLSNHYLVGLIDYGQLCFPYNKLYTKYGVKVINDLVVDIDLTKRKVFTSRGYIDYNYLVLSTGIEYDTENYPFYKEALWHFPAAFSPGSEHLYLRRLIEEFEGENVVITVPKMPYRCPPAPYERAAMLLSYIKENGLKAHMYFIDANEHPPVLSDGFMKAYEDFYRGTATYITGATVKDIDVGKKKVITDKGEFVFDFGSLIPPMRAPRFLKEVGLLGKGDRWVSVDPMTYETEFKNVFVIGDSCETYLPKSGYAANSEAKVVAKIIGGRIKGKEYRGELIQHGICYAMVNLKSAIVMEVEYKYNVETREIQKILREDNTWKVSTAKRYYEWARGLWRDMFL